ncbi:AAA family ATPase [Escherichia coli]|uniref:AAA family ATPase n=1 Tax=Escherichia coli TaxID=562 RepID=UPI003EEDC8F0
MYLKISESLRERQEIDFAPVTLLLGPNSAGKTTILIALFYLQQILDREQCDPIYLEAMGNRRIDGFRISSP